MITAASITPSLTECCMSTVPIFQKLIMHLPYILMSSLYLKWYGLRLQDKTYPIYLVEKINTRVSISRNFKLGTPGRDAP